MTGPGREARLLSRLARGRRSFPRATARWTLDSSGFTQLSLQGRWTISAAQYAREARLYFQEIGRLDFAAPQDWMCEPWILRKTGLSVREHRKEGHISRVAERAQELDRGPLGGCQRLRGAESAASERAGNGLPAP